MCQPVKAVALCTKISGDCELTIVYSGHNKQTNKLDVFCMRYILMMIDSGKSFNPKLIFHGLVYEEDSDNCILSLGQDSKGTIHVAIAYNDRRLVVWHGAKWNSLEPQEPERFQLKQHCQIKLSCAPEEIAYSKNYTTLVVLGQKKELQSYDI